MMDAGTAPGWLARLNDDPRPWLLDPETPAVRHLALRLLLDRPDDDPEVQGALTGAMRTNPIEAILGAQHSEGYWIEPGGGYGPKYRGTVWQLIFLDQLGADGRDPRIQTACEYILSHTQSASGGFGAWGSRKEGPPPPSSVVHCLNGNLLRALIGFGRLEDERVQRAVDWQARSITGEGFGRYYQSGTAGPGFRCAVNGQLPSAWGAIKALLALARIPPEHRAPYVQRAVEAGAEFLLGRSPALADYPAWGDRISPSWFKLGFRSGYVANVLQNLEVLCALGFGSDPRLRPALEWLLSKQDGQGRWKNQYAYSGKTRVDFEQQGRRSKSVTLRACHVLKQAVQPGNGRQSKSA